MVDAGRVRGLLETLRAYRKRLGELAGLPVERYVSEEAFAGRYLVQAAAQTCIDIANHVISSEGWRAPKEFRDSFNVLEENGVIDPSLAERLRTLAGMRNRLVHLYAEVDDSLVHALLAEGLEDLDAFARAVAGLIDSSSDDSG